MTHAAFLRALTFARVAIFAVGLASQTWAGQALGQANQSSDASEVTFHLKSADASAPVKISRILIGDQEVPLDTPFPVSGMWLRKVSILVDNSSPKTIVQGGVTLIYPGTGTGSTASPILSSPLTLGKHPQHYFLKNDGSSRDSTREAQLPEINIAPGKTMAFSFPPYNGTDHAYGDVDQSQAAKLVGRLTLVNIVLNRFYFSDGSMWAAGKYYIPQPPPSLWKEVSKTDFFNSGPVQAQ